VSDLYEYHLEVEWRGNERETPGEEINRIAQEQNINVLVAGICVVCLDKKIEGPPEDIKLIGEWREKVWGKPNKDS
jgi:hypothetical protein